MKEMYLEPNPANGIDLMVERDAGNLVRILTGKPEYSQMFWNRLRDQCDAALDMLELEIEFED